MIGHWVVMKTKIKGIDLIAMAYAWSNNDIAYMISTFGNTSAWEEDYISNEKNTAFDGLNDTKTCNARTSMIFCFDFFLLSTASTTRGSMDCSWKRVGQRRIAGRSSLSPTLGMLLLIISICCHTFTLTFQDETWPLLTWRHQLLLGIFCKQSKERLSHEGCGNRMPQ